MNDDARALKSLANSCGKRIFDEAVKIREELIEKGMDDEIISTILLDGTVAALASIFSYTAAADGGEEEQTKIVEEIHTKIFDLLRDEHVRRGGKAVKISLKKDS